MNSTYKKCTRLKQQPRELFILPQKIMTQVRFGVKLGMTTMSAIDDRNTGGYFLLPQIKLTQGQFEVNFTIITMSVIGYRATGGYFCYP